MSLPLLTLIAVCVLPLLWSWVSGYHRRAQFGVIDNKNPRQQNSQLKEAGARAVSAQKNAWEAAIVYIAAYVAVTSSNVPVADYATLTLVFLALRVLHGVCYIINQDILRSLAFTGGYGICIYMMILAV